MNVGGDPFGYLSLIKLGLIVLAPVGAIGGAVVGAISSEPTQVVQEQETALRTTLVALNAQQELQEQVIQTVREQIDPSAGFVSEEGSMTPDESVSYRFLRTQGVDTILEVGVLSFGLTGEKGINPSLALIMTARAKLIRSLSNTVLSDYTLECQSFNQSFSQWAASNAKAIREQYSQCLQRLSEKITEEVFFSSYFTSPSNLLQYPILGIRPEYPEVNYDTFPMVDSNQPTLRWEKFPPSTEPETQTARSQISHTTYDLRIWRAEGEDPGILVYARENLSTPFHHLEEPLEPATNYFWTVRARFELNGQPRRSEWGLAGDLSARSETIPNTFCYRLTTPSLKPHGRIKRWMSFLK